MTEAVELPEVVEAFDPEFVRTEQADQALGMCRSVMAARPYCRIGQITGGPGTGKSRVTKWLAEETGAIRIEAWTKISDRELLSLLVDGCVEKGIPLDRGGWNNTLFKRLMVALHGRLIIVDEANHLKWAQLEKLRSLSDRSECGLVIVGTDILARTISTAGVGTYLEQLRQRIGAKRIIMRPLQSDDEFVAYCVLPRFGKVSRKTAQQFRALTGGVWRTALELGDACDRLMRVNAIEKLDETVLQTAAALMAGAR